MPEAAHEHGVEIVDIGVEVLTVVGKEHIVGHKKGHNDTYGERHPGRLCEEGHSHEGASEYEIGCNGGVAVAANGDIEIILQPVGERHVPAFPKACGVGGLVGRIEVFGQVESHKHGHADGDIGIAREVGIDLEGIYEEGAEILEGGVENRIVEHAIHEADGKIVAEDNLLQEAVDDPEHGYAELASAQEIGFVELRDKLVGAHYGACHQLGEEGGVESEVEYIAGMGHLLPIHIYDIADILECEKGDAYGQYDHGGVESGATGALVGPLGEEVHHLEAGVGDGVEDIGEEIGILEVAQHGEVDYDAEYHPYFPLRVDAAVGPEHCCGGFGVGQGAATECKMVHQYAQQVSGEGGEQEQEYEGPGGFIIEKQAHKEEVGVAPHLLALPGLWAAGKGRDYEAKHHIHQKEECPKVKLGEEQGVCLVEGKEGGEIFT